MALTPEDAIEEILRIYGEEELAAMRALIGSSTLRAAATLIVDAQLGQANIVIPHYWAVYYHDGRSGFSAPDGRFLVFFADPEDDPRIEGGYPITREDVRRLTREEFEAGLAENQARAEAGEGPFMFVVRSVGPAGPHPFMDELSRGAAERMDPIALAALDAHVQEVLDAEGAQKSTARAKL